MKIPPRKFSFKYRLEKMWYEFPEDYKRVKPKLKQFGADVILGLGFALGLVMLMLVNALR